MKTYYALLLLTALLVSSVSAFAAEEGFIYKGKQYVVYRDGEKVGKTLAELFPSETHSEKRKPASFELNSTATIRFTQNDSHICFYASAAPYDPPTALSCLSRK